MQATAFHPQPRDSHLWWIALGLSLVINTAIVGTVALAVIQSEELRRSQRATVKPPDPGAVAMIYPQTTPEPAANPARPPADPAAPLPAANQRFSRTSPDQAAERPDHPAFIGERNTRATSDRNPTPGAPPMPSQAGVAPRHPGDLETTESRYRDGKLAADPFETTDPPPVPPTPAEPPAPADESTQADANAGKPPASSPPPPRPELLQGPHPVDIPVPRETTTPASPPEEHLRPAPEPEPEPVKDPAQDPAGNPANPDKSTPRPPLKDPVFRGNQHKTAITGSISRTGRSALDVEDSLLGRYQASLSRAVELEWQRNCVRHRDFITPGFLTVRFFVEPNGKVRSVQFVGDMETGEVQKGFTLNSIRDAGIPPMPPALRKQYEEEPLELLFRFYF